MLEEQNKEEEIKEKLNYKLKDFNSDMQSLKNNLKGLQESSNNANGIMKEMINKIEKILLEIKIIGRSIEGQNKTIITEEMIEDANINNKTNYKNANEVDNNHINNILKEEKENKKLKEFRDNQCNLLLKYCYEGNYTMYRHHITKNNNIKYFKSFIGEIETEKHKKIEGNALYMLSIAFANPLGRLNRADKKSKRRVEFVNDLINIGCDLYYPNKENNQILTNLLKANDMIILKKYIEAIKEIPNEVEGVPIFEYVVNNNSYGIATMLIENGMNVELKNKDIPIAMEIIGKMKASTKHKINFIDYCINKGIEIGLLSDKYYVKPTRYSNRSGVEIYEKNNNYNVIDYIIETNAITKESKEKLLKDFLNREEIVSKIKNDDVTYGRIQVVDMSSPEIMEIYEKTLINIETKDLGVNNNSKKMKI